MKPFNAPLLILFTLFHSCLLFGQLLEKTENGYFYDSQSINRKTLLSLYQKHPEALKQFKKGALKYTATTSLVTAGGVYLGEQIGRLTSTGSFKWKEGGLAVGLVTVGIFLSKGMNDNFNNAVALYNKSNPQKKRTTTVLIRTQKDRLVIHF